MPDRLDRLSDAVADRCTIERELGAGGMATVEVTSIRLSANKGTVP